MRTFAWVLMLATIGLAPELAAQISARAPASEKLLSGLGTTPKPNRHNERPNCAGVALFNTGVLTKLEYVDPVYDLPGILKKCYTLNASGRASRGDIGVMFSRHNPDDPVHAWVEVGDPKKVLSKNGEEAVPIEYHERQAMLKLYAKEFDGKRVAFFTPLLNAKTGKRCQIELKKYRLDTWKEHEANEKHRR